jgi:hypothetical protein
LFVEVVRGGLVGVGMGRGECDAEESKGEGGREEFHVVCRKVGGGWLAGSVVAARGMDGEWWRMSAVSEL